MVTEPHRRPTKRPTLISSARCAPRARNNRVRVAKDDLAGGVGRRAVRQKSECAGLVRDLLCRRQRFLGEPGVAERLGGRDAPRRIVLQEPIEQVKARRGARTVRVPLVECAREAALAEVHTRRHGAARSKRHSRAGSPSSATAPWSACRGCRQSFRAGSCLSRGKDVRL